MPCPEMSPKEMVGSPTFPPARVDTHISLPPDKTPTTLADLDTIQQCETVQTHRHGIVIFQTYKQPHQ